MLQTFSSQNLVPVLSNKDVQEKLRAHLPEGTTLPSTEKELRDSIQSPQFRQAVSVFRSVSSDVLDIDLTQVLSL